jgi:hypothetical protein
MDRLRWEQKKPIYDALGLTFSKEQEAVLRWEGRFPVISGGERSGKSFVSAADLLPHVLYLPHLKADEFLNPDGSPKFKRNYRPRNPHFVIFGPTYSEPRIEFQYLEGWLRDLGALIDEGPNKPSKPQQGPWKLVTKHGVVVSTWSMEDPRSIRGIDLEGAVVAEAGLCPYDGIERVQGRVSAKRGFVIYSGTMENSHQWLKDWVRIGKRDNDIGIKSFVIPTWANLHEFPGGENDPEILRLKAFYPEDIFLMRVAGEPAPLRNRVIPEFTENHIVSLNVPNDAEVYIAVDPGYASAYAVLFVARMYHEGRRIFYVCDEIYERGKITEEIISLCRRSKYWGMLTTTKEGAIDIAAKAHDSNESVLDKWRAYAPEIKVWHYSWWPEARLIERLRTSAKNMEVLISPKCRGLIMEIGLGDPVFPDMGPWVYPMDKSRRIIGEKPVDRNNHAVKALAYLLMSVLGPVDAYRKNSFFLRLSHGKGRKSNSWTLAGGKGL